MTAMPDNCLGQSLERIAERGGFGLFRLCIEIAKRALAPAPAQATSEEGKPQ